MKPQESYHINGHTYVLKEEPKKQREPIKAYAFVCEGLPTEFHSRPGTKLGFERVELHEINGKKIADAIINAMEGEYYRVRGYSIAEKVLESLGFTDKGVE